MTTKEAKKKLLDELFFFTASPTRELLYYRSKCILAAYDDLLRASHHKPLYKKWGERFRFVAQWAEDFKERGFTNDKNHMLAVGYIWAIREKLYESCLKD